jgi:hypothetical protein
MSDYLGPTVTLLVGFVALLVYQKQKRDNKRDAANILLIEIEGAEKQLQVLKDGGTPKGLKESFYLMPSASWSKYRHLFARNFTAREWDIITNFYARCKQFDEAVTWNGTFIRQDIEAYRTSINLALALAALTCVQAIDDTSEGADSDEHDKIAAADNKYVVLRERLTRLYMEPKNLYTYDPQKPINDAVGAIGSVDGTISTSTIGTKLRKTAKPTFFQRIFSRQS